MPARILRSVRPPRVCLDLLPPTTQPARHLLVLRILGAAGHGRRIVNLWRFNSTNAREKRALHLPHKDEMVSDCVN